MFVTLSLGVTLVLVFLTFLPALSLGPSPKASASAARAALSRPGVAPRLGAAGPAAPWTRGWTAIGRRGGAGTIHVG